MSEVRKTRFASINEGQITTPRYGHRPKNIQIPPESILKIKRRGSLNPLEDLVQCALCMDKLTDPKMLPCQHTFCLNCLQTLVVGDAKQIECPTCKKTTPLEKGSESLDNLPGNVYIDSILKLLAGNSSPVTPTQIGPETGCIKCQTMCQFSEHACQHCKQIFCGVCWPEHVNELREKLTSLQEQLKESHIRLDHRVDAFNDRCLQLEENIKAATELKIKEIKKREEGCLSEANKIKQDGMKSSAELRDRLKQMENNIEEKEFDRITDEKQKINHFMLLHRNTAALLDELSRWGDTRTIFDASSFKIDYETDASLDAEADDDSTVGALGIGNPLESSDSMAMYYRSRSFTPRLTWTKCLRPAGVAVAPWAPNCIYVAGTDSRQIYGVDKLKGKLLFRISSPHMICPVGITFSQSTEEMFVSDKWKHCVHVFSKAGVYLRSFGKKGSTQGQYCSPEGIAVGHDNRLYICDTGNDRVQIINGTDGKYISSFGITGTGQSTINPAVVMNYKYTEFNVPTGIAVINDRVIIADSGNRRIKVYTMDGLKVREFGSLGKNKGQFRTPEVLAVDPMGFILVGDSGNARVQIFRPSGTLVRVFTSKFAWVSGIHVTPQLEIIISDYKAHTVSVF